MIDIGLDKLESIYQQERDRERERRGRGGPIQEVLYVDATRNVGVVLGTITEMSRDVVCLDDVIAVLGALRVFIMT